MKSEHIVRADVSDDWEWITSFVNENLLIDLIQRNVSSDVNLK